MNKKCARLIYIWIQIKQITSNIHLLEVVGRDSDTQLQVDENSHFQSF